MDGRRRASGAVLGAVLQSVVVCVLLVVAYYQAPLNRRLTPGTAVLFVVALGLLAAAFTLQIRAILASSRPRLRAIRALATTVPLLLVIFASVYCIIDSQQAHAFSEQLSRTDGLYFTVTVFATVGFGDITPVTQLARIMVTVQMLVGLLTVGVIAKVVLGAVQTAEARGPDARTEETPQPVRER